MNISKKIKLLLFTQIFVLLFASLSYAEVLSFKNFQFDVQGDSKYSRHNFTDLTRRYELIDTWVEMKLAYWLDSEKSISPFLSIIPVHVSDKMFWWQRYVETSLGIQWYPVKYFDLPQYLKSFRFFAMTSKRQFYRKPGNENPQDSNVYLGVDYYYDNLFSTSPIIWTSWSKVAYDKTNYSKLATGKYKSVYWTGNVKCGPRFEFYNDWGISLLYPYLFTEWNYTSKYHARWWQNYLKVGTGIRFYPKADEKDSFTKDLMRRFHIYVEYLYLADWLRNEPSTTSNVSKTDFRVGMGFSTSGYYRDNNK
jgi:hypothetical protein